MEEAAEGTHTEKTYAHALPQALLSILGVMIAQRRILGSLKGEVGGADTSEIRLTA